MSLKNQIICKIVGLYPPSASTNTPPSFLILSTTGLGDTLWGTPALRALRQTYPTSYIAVLTSPIGKEVLMHNPHIDDLFVLQKPLLCSLLLLRSILKKKHFSHIVNFHTSQRAVLPFAATLGAKTLIGTRGLQKGLDTLLTHPIDKRDCHEIERRLDMVRILGADPSDVSMELPLTIEDQQTVDVWIDRNHPQPCIGLHPGAKDPFKRWGKEQFISIGKRLALEHGYHLFITGTPAETQLANEIASQIPNAQPLTHLSLRSLAALIQRLQLFITNDTGPMHVAFTMQTPTIALFAPTDPLLCGAYGISKHVMIAKSPTCIPCLRKKCLSPFCLLQIGVDEVYNQILEYIS